MKWFRRDCVAFMDFTKAFDSIDLTILLTKLQLVGVPVSFCRLLRTVWSQMKTFLKAGQRFSLLFTPNRGNQQGDIISPILFSLYVSDLPDNLLPIGCCVNGSNVNTTSVNQNSTFCLQKTISYIFFADDACFPSSSPEGLQEQLEALRGYCLANKLTVNVKKTKVMYFFKGRLSNHNANFGFTYDSFPIERVKSFCYLGFTFTQRLSFSPHVENLVSKGRSRLGVMQTQINIRNLKLDVALQLFDTYVFSGLRYGLPLWINNCSESVMNSLNATFSKFLKSYLGVPFHSNNAIVHLITGTCPLVDRLKHIAPHSTGGLSFPLLCMVSNLAS